MPQVDRLEASEVAALVERALAASTFQAALPRWRTVFVERLDFRAAAGTLRLTSAGLPPTATRLAERDGVQVVALALPDEGRVTAVEIRAALKDVRATLNGDLLLIVTNAARSEWHLVYPAPVAGREALRRLIMRPGEPRRTAISQLTGVYDSVRGGSDIRTALERAYDVKAVTREFYERYKQVFNEVERTIIGFSDADAERKRLFAQRLFNRLMFVAFIEKKGWLSFGGDSDYLNALWKDYQRHKTAGSNFYRERLDPLFFAGLNTAHEVDVINNNGPNVLQQIVGKVPYLNGGLFDRDTEGDDNREEVLIPDACFAAILDQLFNRFNFTVTESTPWDVVVAVDPEMLGKVFEELVTGRHESGSYYTPKEIVSFMCREALKGFLETATPGEPAAIARFVDKTEPDDLHDREAVLDALRRVTVCDPACGSRAYLLGMLQELFELRRRLFELQRLDNRTAYDRKLEIIANNVYGVDIDEFAINIARLRLWLSLVVEYDGPTPPPLPNLTFKIERGDSLTAPDPSAGANIGFVRVEVDRYLALKRRYLKAHYEEKRTLLREIEEAKQQIKSWTPAAGAGSFDWPVEFAEIFTAEQPEQRGFDIVLANPPYVRQELITQLKPTLGTVYAELYSGTADLYVYFYYRGFQLLKMQGMLAYISSNKWLRAGYGAKLRDHVEAIAAVSSVMDFGDLPVFESASAYPVVVVAQKGCQQADFTYTRVLTLNPPYPNVSVLAEEMGQGLPPSALAGTEWVLNDISSATRARQMRTRSVSLAEYVGGHVYRGVVTGLNRVFVIDGEMRDKLASSDARSLDLIRPLASGENVRRWHIAREDKWLIFTRRGTDIQRYPAVARYLKQWQIDLTPKNSRADKIGRKPGPYKWFEIQDEIEYHEIFSHPKIVFPDISKEPRFTIDTDGLLFTNTVYFVDSDDLYLLAILNSQPVLSLYCEVSSQVRGGYMRYQRQYVEGIPVPRPSPTDHTAIADIAQRCLTAKGQGPQVAEWEAEINERVAKLYGL